MGVGAGRDHPLGALGLELHHGGGKRVLAEDPHREQRRDQEQHEAEDLERNRHLGGLNASVETYQRQPGEHRDDEDSHEDLVGGGLIPL